MAEKEISVTGQDGDYLLIAGGEQHCRGRIHKSLITDNGFVIVKGKFSVNEDLYRAWFTDSIAEAAEETRELFYSHIPLFVKKQKAILRNSRFYSVLSPRPFFGGIAVRGRRATLGELLLIWKNEPDFSLKCECGGKGLIYFFGGSPFSGACEAKGVCLQCGKECYKGPKSFDKSFAVLLRTSEKYRPIEPFSRNPVSVKELVAALEGGHQPKRC